MGADRRGAGSRSQAGYVLLTLLLFITLLMIAAAVAAPKIAFSIRRDREEELVHRGVQYTRAIRAFTRKFGRYPVSLDELQNTNGQRFLRKRYKDPITGKEFKLLRLTDVQMSGGAGVAAFTQGSQRQMQSMNALTNGVPAGTPTPPAPVQDPNAASDQNLVPDNPAQNGSAAAVPKANTSGPITPAGDSTGASRFGGGAIVGVVSPSKLRTIREYGHKNHYNDWKFYYDPGYDRGFLIKGPTVMMPILSTALRPGEAPDAPGVNQPQVNQPQTNQQQSNQLQSQPEQH